MIEQMALFSCFGADYKISRLSLKNIENIRILDILRSENRPRE